MRVRKVVAGLLVVSSIALLAYSCVSRSSEGSTSATESAPIDTSSRPAAPASAEPTVAPSTTPVAVNNSADDAARQGLAVIFTWYPGTDATQNDAYGRARKWLTDQLADRMIIDAATERGPSVQWGQWAREHAKIVADVRVGCSGCPDDTDSSVHRVATIKQTVITEAGTDTVDPDTTVWVTLIRQDESWLIDDIRY